MSAHYVRRLTSKQRDAQMVATRPINGTRRRTVQMPDYAQELFVDHRYKVLYGGRGAARSWSVARALLIGAAAKPTRVLCTREMQSSLRDSVHQLLRDQIDLLELPGYTVTDRAIRHRNGSLFLFEGLWHNITKIKSLEGIDVCWVEEAERITHASWKVLIPTIRKPGSEIWVTFNPDQETDATWMRFVVNRPKTAWVLKVNARDNPWFPPELIAEREYDYSVDPESADHVWEGNIRTLNDSQILRGKWIVQDFTVPYILEREDDPKSQRVPAWNGPYQGIDFGFGADPFAGIRCWTHDDVLYIEHETWKLHLELDDAPLQLCEDIPRFELYRSRADSSRPDSIAHLRKHGIPYCTGAEKGPGSVKDGIAHLRHYKQIIIHSRCKKTQDEFKRYCYKVDEHSGDILPIIVDKHNHLIDCLRYALEPMIKKNSKRTARIVWAGLEVAAEERICPRCESRVSDDLICPHCGDDSYFVAAQENGTVIPLPRAPEVVIQERVHAMTNPTEEEATVADTPAAPTLPQRMKKLRGLNA